MTDERSNVVPFRRRARRRRGAGCPPGSKQRRAAGKTWRQALREVRPYVLLIGWVTAAYIVSLPSAFEPPDLLQTEPRTIANRFNRCDAGAGHYYCVIDGDTFRIGRERVRVVGIDTAERNARCPAEAALAEQSTRALQEWLNRGPFQVTARLDEPRDRYGRALRIIKRTLPDGREDSLADWMQAHGGARSYLGGMRGGWC